MKLGRKEKKAIYFIIEYLLLFYWILVLMLRFDEIIVTKVSILTAGFLMGLAHHLLANEKSMKSESTFKEFLKLKNKWEEETFLTSSGTDLISNSAYRKIIAMGKTALPWIFNDLRETNNHWFFALEKITGENPVRKENVGRVEVTKKDWLSWANENGYGSLLQKALKELQKHPHYVPNNIELPFAEEIVRNTSELIAKINFNKSAVELTPTGNIKYKLEIKKDTILTIIKPFNNPNKIEGNGVGFSVSIEGESVKSDFTELDDLIEAADSYSYL